MLLAATSKIEKEFIATCNFTNGRIALSKEESRQNDRKLYCAMLLGNAFHGKVKIQFSTTEGRRTVETTVWAFTDSFVMLKGGVFIPTESVVSVEL